MSNWTYKHHLTSNARVLITKNPDEPVTFAFPIKRTYWQSVRQSALHNVFGLWIGIHVAIAIYFLAPYALGAIIRELLTAQHIVTDLAGRDWTVEIVMLAIVVYAIGIPIAFTYVLALDKDRFCRWLPKIGYYHALLSRNRTAQRTFMPNHLTSDNLCIIDSFGNVFLRYTTTGDFKKYLQTVSITEHPYKVRYETLFGRITKESNEHEFQAVFTFSKKPKTGSLKTHYI